MRSLLGGAKEKLVHDPGAEGPEGEGEAAMTMMVIVYAVALGLFIYGTTAQRTFNARSRLAATAPHRTSPAATIAAARRADAHTPRAAPRRAAPRRRAASHAASRAPPPERRVFGCANHQKKEYLCRQKSARIDFSETGASYESLNFSQAQLADRLAHRRFSFLFLPISILFTTPQRNSPKKDKDHDALQAAELADVANFKAKLEAQKAEGASAEDPDHALTDEEIRDKIKQEKWTEPEADNVSPEFRSKFIRTASFGALDTSDKGPVRDALYSPA